MLRSPTVPKPKRQKKQLKPVKIDHFYDINCSYLSPNEMSDSLFGDRKSNLSVFHNNIRSLTKNFDSLTETFDKCSELPDIIAVSETRLIKNKHIPGFKEYLFEYVDPEKEVGGVGAYISNNLVCSVRRDLNLGAKHCEDLWISVDQNKNVPSNSKDYKPNFVVGIIYRHPDHKYEKFCECLCDTLNTLNKTKTDYIIVGDININTLKYNIAQNVTDYVNALHSVGCNVCIDSPTRVTSDSSSCIDHIYSNLCSSRLFSNIIMNDVSDHFAL